MEGNKMDLEQIGYFLYMAEQEKKQQEEFTENENTSSWEFEPQQKEKDR